MALALQQGGIGIESWRDWIGNMPGFAKLDNGDVEAVVKHMLVSDILSLSEGMLWFGAKGEGRFGRRNFMELLSSFTSEPLFIVRYGRQHLGSVDRASFTLRHDKPPVLLLAGHSWIVNHLDWKNGVAFVEPSADEGKSRWLGSGQPLTFSYCQAVKRVLVGDPPGSHLSTRATVELDRARENFEWLKAHETSLATENSKTRWWTFGGLLANSCLAAMLREAGVRVGRADNFAIRIEDSAAVAKWDSITDNLRSIKPEHLVTPVDPKALSQLKFSECLPRELASKELEARLTDRSAVLEILRERVGFLTGE
jgi:ATP-dependent Lhr-like helicase